MKKNADQYRMDTASHDDQHDREQVVEKVREREREAVEKAMDVALKAYGDAFRELEKY